MDQKWFWALLRNCIVARKTFFWILLLFVVGKSVLKKLIFFPRKKLLFTPILGYFSKFKKYQRCAEISDDPQICPKIPKYPKDASLKKFWPPAKNWRKNFENLTPPPILGSKWGGGVKSGCVVFGDFVLTCKYIFVKL